MLPSQCYCEGEMRRHRLSAWASGWGFVKAQEILPPVFRTRRYMMVQKGPLKVEGEIKILQSHKTELQSDNQKDGVCPTDSF